MKVKMKKQTSPNAASERATGASVYRDQQFKQWKVRVMICMLDYLRKQKSEAEPSICTNEQLYQSSKPPDDKTLNSFKDLKKKKNGPRLPPLSLTRNCQMIIAKNIGLLRAAAATTTTTRNVISGWSTRS